MKDNTNIYRQAPAAGGNPSKLVIFLHGYGADGKDLIDLANPFSMALPNATFISPDAPFPCAMSPQGRQWFSIEEIPMGAIQASNNLLSLIEKETMSIGLKFKDVILIGFSQGAMMAMQCLLISKHQLAGIIGYSGALRLENVQAAKDNIIDDKHKFFSTPVLLVHGEEDEVVPFNSLEKSKLLLDQVGFDTNIFARPNLGHGIDPEGISKGMEMLKQLN